MLNSDLKAEQKRLQLAVNSGIVMPIAGLIVWSTMALLANMLAYENWMLFCLFSTGFIFPLALILQYPMKSKFIGIKSPLNSLTFPAILAANFHWPITVMIIQNAPELFPIALGISTAPMWPIVGWQYGSQVGIAHFMVRIIGVTALAFSIPDPLQAGQFITGFVALVYAGSILAFGVEVSMHRRAAHA
jgi:hypothetical protein